MNLARHDPGNASDTVTLLQRLRAHAMSDGEVDLAALTAAGTDLTSPSIRSEIDRLQRTMRLRYEPAAPWPIDRICLFGAARRDLPDPPPHPSDRDDDTPATIEDASPRPPAGPPSSIRTC